MLSILNQRHTKRAYCRGDRSDLSSIALANFLGIFFGYAAYYLVRKNFALAMPYLVEQGFSRGDLGFPFGDLDCLWIFEIHHGFGIGSLESARFPARRFDSGGGSDVVYGLCAMGDVEHCGDVCTVVPLRLVRGWGGRRVVVLWCTGGRRKNVAALCRCGTVRTTSVVVFRAAVPAGWHVQ